MLELRMGEGRHRRPAGDKRRVRCDVCIRKWACVYILALPPARARQCVVRKGNCKGERRGGSVKGRFESRKWEVGGRGGREGRTSAIWSTRGFHWKNKHASLPLLLPLAPPPQTVSLNAHGTTCGYTDCGRRGREC